MGPAATELSGNSRGDVQVNAVGHVSAFERARFIYEYMKIQFLPRNKHNTIHHQGQMVNSVHQNNRCLLSQSQGRHEYTVEIK
jgi:hypothetical protein